MKSIPFHTPLLYRNIGVYRGIPNFLIFVPKHRLWVLVRTASTRRFLRVPTINVLSRNKKNIKIFSENFHFLQLMKNGRVFVMETKLQEIEIITHNHKLCDIKLYTD